MTKINMAIGVIEGEIADKQRELDAACELLARSFSREGGPDWESSDAETKWRTLRTKIRTLEGVLSTFRALGL